MKANPKISIIIPLYVVCDRFFEDLKKYDLLSYSNFEVLVVCDKKVKLPKLLKAKTKLILTGLKNSGPAEKRDIGIKYAKGDICAFIDDDAYPDRNWLKNAISWFHNPDIVAVGGPGVTPPEDNFFQKIGGFIIESYLCSGGVQYRFYPIKTTIFVEDYPAYNLLVRKSVLKKIEGYGSTYYGGEDTLLCIKLLKYGKIVYDPQVLVYHHRRSFPYYHLRQIAGVGLHRGYFFKKYPETSRKLFYLLPTMLTLLLFLGIVSIFLFPSLIMMPFFVIFSMSLVLGTLSILTHGASFGTALFAGFGILLTHIVYGLYFVKGILTKDLVR